jgi:serine/threonine protein kinase
VSFSLSTHELELGKLHRILRNRYELVDQLGKGGMGTVHIARDLQFAQANRLVAVKELPLNGLSPDETRKASLQFEREAMLLARLSHPAVPVVLDYFSEGRSWFLAMEYIRGQTLEQLLKERREPMKLEQVVHYGLQLCDVLAYLHGIEPEPIVFRDIKPANIIIDPHGRVHLVDFGIARDWVQDRQHTIIGTEGYAPPEQYRGQTIPRSDIFALGATLHHMLTNQDPRLHPPFTFHERPLHKYNSNASNAMQLVLDRALAKNPTERFPSMHAFAAALQLLNITTHPPQTHPLHQVSEENELSSEIWHSMSVTHPLWQAEGTAGITALALVSAETLLALDESSYLTLFSTQNGNLLWRRNLPYNSRNELLVTQEQLVMCSPDGKIWSYHLMEGRILWQTDLKQNISAHPSLQQEMLFVPMQSGNIVAVSLKNGQIAGKLELHHSIVTTPLVETGQQPRVYVGNTQHEVLCWKNGKVEWNYEAHAHILGKITRTEQAILVATRSGKLLALEVETGWEIWQHELGAWNYIPPIVENQLNWCFVPQKSGNLCAIELATGKIIWTAELKQPIINSPCLNNQKLYLPVEDATLICLDSVTGTQEWAFKTLGDISTSPICDGRSVYFGTAQSNLVAITI